MVNLLNELVTYLSNHAALVPGVSAFYNEMPEEPAKCIVVQEVYNGIYVPAQIDAEIRSIKVTVREANNTLAAQLAQKCWRWLFTDDPLYDTNKQVETTGFITLPDGSVVQARLLGSPLWEKADQQSRKYFCFYAQIISSR